MVNKHYGVRTDRYKLIHFYELGVWELYDLQNDIQEMNNLYGNTNYESVVTELKKELQTLQVKYDDPIREKYPL